MGFLVFVTFVFIFMIRDDMKLSRNNALGMLGIYAVFILWEFFRNT